MTPRLITILTFLIGLGLFSYSLTLPYYKDQKSADELIGNSYDMEKLTTGEDHFSIPVNLFFTFILLTLRAG